MRNFIGIAPAAVFFAAYYISGRDFHAATMALMAAVAAQIALLAAFKMRPTSVEWTTAALVLIFGSATLLLQKTEYLQIKTTVVNWLFGGALLAADFGWKKNIVRALLGKFFTADYVLWRRASTALSAMFFFIGALNLAAIRNFSEETWVWLKTFAYPGINFIFLLGVIAYLAKNGAPKNS